MASSSYFTDTYGSCSVALIYINIFHLSGCFCRKYKQLYIMLKVFFTLKTLKAKLLFIYVMQLLEKHKTMDSMVELLELYEEEDQAYGCLLEASTQLYQYLLQPFRDMRELAMLRRQHIKVTTCTSFTCHFNFFCRGFNRGELSLILFCYSFF